MGARQRKGKANADGSKQASKRRARGDAIAARQRRVALFFSKGPYIVGAIATACAAYFAWSNLGGGVVLLDPSRDAAQVGRAFFGGDPWLVLCTDSLNRTYVDGLGYKTAGPGEAAPLPDLFRAATGKVLARGIRVGLLDCNATLPSSGLTSYQRLRLKGAGVPPPADPAARGAHPVLFLAAGGERAQRIQPQYLANPKWNLARHVARRVDKTFGARVVTNQKQLRRYCLSRRRCGIVLFSGRAAAKDRDDEGRGRRRAGNADGWKDLALEDRYTVERLMAAHKPVAVPRNTT